MKTISTVLLILNLWVVFEREEFGTEIAAGQTVHGRVGFQVPKDKNEHDLIFVFKTLSRQEAAIRNKDPEKVFISLFDN